MVRRTINVALNRVEGDLELSAEIDDGVVTDAWSSGTLYRGFEQIMIGRGALDGLVITPRICGICSTSHLIAAARALDMVSGIEPPPNARRIRMLASLAEQTQSDLRHAFLMYTADFTNPVYQDTPLYEEAVRRYAPFKGETVLDVIRTTKKYLEIVALIGGQWPHSSYMVPGGVVSMPNVGDRLQCNLLVNQGRSWYEKRILGCSLERWDEVQSAADLDAWLDESEAHWNSDLGFYIRYSRAIGLDRIGGGHGNFVSYGNGSSECRYFIPAGFMQEMVFSPLDQTKITEHVAYSWFLDYDGGKHPWEGETRPYATGSEGQKYSWAKAPRYDNLPAETGPLAEMLIARNPLFMDLVAQGGPSAFVRELARLTRPSLTIPAMGELLAAVDNGPFYLPPGKISDGDGIGLAGATRGALGHWVKIRDGKIAHYQIITPTAWNASPRDSFAVPGPWEMALVGVVVKDLENPVELGHIVRSFDACLVCTVHTVFQKHPVGKLHL